MNRLRADFILLLVAFIWGAAFAVQRVAAQHFDAFTFNGLRFLLGGLVLLPLSRKSLSNRNKQPQFTNSKETQKANQTQSIDRKSLTFIFLGGIFLFGASALQQVALEYTTAGNAGFITTLYVVFVPILLMIFWREKIHWRSWVGAGVALMGSLLLSTGGGLRLAKGDGLVVGSAVFFALHVILVSRAVKHMDVFTFSAGQYLVASAINLLVSAVMRMELSGLASGWWTVVFIGLISTAGGYTLQVLGQKYAPPTDTTILLSMEAVFAALAGYLFLREMLLPVQLLGCGLILMAVLMTQLKSMRSSAEVGI